MTDTEILDNKVLLAHAAQESDTDITGIYSTAILEWELRRICIWSESLLK